MTRKATPVLFKYEMLEALINRQLQIYIQEEEKKVHYKKKKRKKFVRIKKNVQINKFCINSKTEQTISFMKNYI